MKRRVLVSLAVVVGLIVLLAAMYMIKMYQETAKMAPLATGEITPGLYGLKDEYVNMYLIKVKDKYIAVDAGINAKAIAGELAKVKVNAQDVVAVLLTHTDSDHTGGLELFPQAKIFISSDEEQMINGKTKRFLFFSNKLPYRYETINDGQVLTINGVSVKGILTPGHTPGSMSYVIDGKYLFTGDTMGLNEGKATLFNAFFNMNSERQKEDIKRLATLTDDIRLVLTAHYGIDRDFSQIFEAWRK